MINNDNQFIPLHCNRIFVAKKYFQTLTALDC